MPGCFASGRDETELAETLAEAAELWSGHPVDADGRGKIETARRRGPRPPAARRVRRADLLPPQLSRRGELRRG